MRPDVPPYVGAMRRFLVPLDGSKLAEQAVAMAAELARTHDGEVELLTVLDTVVANGFSDFADSEHIAITQAVNAYMRSVAAEWEAVPIEGHHLVSAPNVAEAIVRFAFTHDMDMIVMASHGRSGLGRWLLGSVAEKVIRSAEVPVLVVPVR